MEEEGVTVAERVDAEVGVVASERGDCVEMESWCWCWC